MKSLLKLKQTRKCLRCCKKFPSRFTFILHLQRKHLKHRKLLVTYKNALLQDFVSSDNVSDVKSEDFSHSELDIKIEFDEAGIVKACNEAFSSTVFKKKRKQSNYYQARAICEFCDMVFCKKNLQQHISLIHLNATNKQNKCVCVSCSREFKNEILLKQHNKNVHMQKSKVLCKICNNLFVNQGTLRKHFQIAHSNNIKKVRCTICNKELKHKYTLIEHMKYVHSSSSRTTCKICNQTIGKKSIKQHILRKHAKFNQSRNITDRITEESPEPKTSKEFIQHIQSNFKNKFRKLCFNSIRLAENQANGKAVLVVPKQEIIEN